MKLRRLFFWSHLAVGVLAGLVIAVMALTGTALTLESTVVGYLERDVRQVDNSAVRLTPDELLQKIRANEATAGVASLTLYADSRRAAVATVGRNELYYINPVTGTIAAAPATHARRFFRMMESWHRTLGFAGEHRIWGKTVNDAASVGFLFLAVSGVYLWWPRNLVRRWAIALRVKFNLSGKARDWNWHTVIGFWCSPILIVLTVTALPLSYKWAGDFIYHITGTTPPVPGSPGLDRVGETAPRFVPGAARVDYQTLFTAAERVVPGWTEITLRLKNPQRGESEDGRERPRRQNSEAGLNRSEGRSLRAVGAGGGEASPRLSVKRSGQEPGGAPTTFTVREATAWPRTAVSTVILDPTSGAVLKHESFGEQNLGRKIRTWMRFLHTGEALGWPGQLLAGLASLFSVVLVVTGFSLAFRRFFSRV